MIETNGAPGSEQANEDYLSAAVACARLRLARLIGDDPPADAELDRAESALAAAETSDARPAMLVLRDRFGLTRFEHDVLLLCVALELDTRVAALCARAQDDPGRPYPTFALAMALFEDPAWEALSPERPLRYWRMIEIHQPGSHPLTACALRADERIVHYVKGLNYLDDRLTPLLVPLDPPVSAGDLPRSQRAAVEAALAELTLEGPTVIQLVGPDSFGKQIVAARVAAALNAEPYRLPLELLPAQTGELENFERLWQREGRLLPVALYVDAGDAERGNPADAHFAALNRFLERAGGLVFLDTREPLPELRRPASVVDVAKPTTAEQRDAWFDAARPGGVSRHAAATLAAQFDLSAATIHRLARRAAPNATANGEPPLERLWDACLAATRPRMDLLAERIDARATWDDLVLPAAELQLLRQIAGQVRHRAQVYDDWGFRRRMNRGLGITALFAGDSGTGKTMAAEVLANELRLNLYRIDLSAVVSKYIGETEKNLRRLFDAAEDGGAVLFFDEADALFGKRSEVKDSHDRYANIEVNYLLQRMEAYRGLAVLATNMKSALDGAFLRRLRFVVDFPFPGPAERRAIWQRVFPGGVPTAGFDFDRLTRLNLSGGNIHNVALSAAFIAAQQGSLASMATVLAAAREEFRKLGLPVAEADFRWVEPARGVA